MAYEWRKVSFEELLAEPVRNGIYKAKEFHGRGAKIVNMGELFAYPRLRSAPMKRVELSASEKSRFLLADGDLIFARRSLTAEGAGKCSVVLQLDEPTTFESSIIRARPDKSKADSLYLYYFFNSPSGFHALDTIRRQVAVAGITGGDLAKLEIPTPPLEEQRAIARILGALDDKIDLNRCINQTLEAMAQAIFKSWFVDFDPVKAKITAIEQGEDPLRAAMRAISGKTDAELDQMPREHHDQLAATAALFPDAMEESELGEIPKGWEVKRIGDLIELAYGKALKSTDRQDGPVPVYGSGGVTGYHNEALVPHGAIIVGRKGTVGSLYWEDEPFFPIDTTFYVKPKATPMIYCFYAMQMLGLDKMNTDAAVPGLNRENVYRLELVKPSVSVLNAFDGLAGQIRKAMRANETASQSLAELRDTLLPKFLSGELSVANMEVPA
ncbi:MAG: hypothetical protein JNIBNLAF_02364 [Nitrosomonas europaea]|uniref:restriction endonuclease subunit S n=1 Tax=Nitrosomonas TaxID=914 RepID=UPI0023F2304A|nr:MULTISPECIES: restriction endonuclease subunit S [Nitrosomonas]MBV6390632.1 hypothetical protein [Nitrosomonas europaea]